MGNFGGTIQAKFMESFVSAGYFSCFLLFYKPCKSRHHLIIPILFFQTKQGQSLLPSRYSINVCWNIPVKLQCYFLHFTKDGTKLLEESDNGLNSHS